MKLVCLPYTKDDVRKLGAFPGSHTAEGNCERDEADRRGASTKGLKLGFGLGHKR
jgi:hypothetical protein